MFSRDALPRDAHIFIYWFRGCNYRGARCVGHCSGALRAREHTESAHVFRCLLGSHICHHLERLQSNYNPDDDWVRWSHLRDQPVLVLAHVLASGGGYCQCHGSRLGQPRWRCDSDIRGVVPLQAIPGNGYECKHCMAFVNGRPCSSLCSDSCCDEVEVLGHAISQAVPDFGHWEGLQGLNVGLRGSLEGSESGCDDLPILGMFRYRAGHECSACNAFQVLFPDGCRRRLGTGRFFRHDEPVRPLSGWYVERLPLQEVQLPGPPLGAVPLFVFRSHLRFHLRAH
mmetsp:Transcript_66613/g.150404  ORF Transcript_66613/g.150404 Transcript_66613/m.150404 type:complete len:284 (-) Transcript_66613:678-1529(-)